MKQIKIIFSVVIFACMTTVGYSTYDNMTMSDSEKLMLANIEAITGNQSRFWWPGTTPYPTPGEDGTSPTPGEGGTESPTCINGGIGSTACSISAGIEIVGSGVTAGCSVNCGTGYYACCSIRCTCKKE